MNLTSDILVPSATNSQRTISLLFIIDQLCRIGGAERILLNIIRLLPRERFLPQVVTFRAETSLDALADFPCPLHVWPLNRTWDVGAIRVALKLHRLVQRERIDIIHTFFETSDIWAGPIARASGARVLVSSRRDMGFLRGRKHRVAYRILSPLFDQVQAVSDEVRRMCLEQDGVAAGRVVTIYNGVDLGRARATPPAHCLPCGADVRSASHVVTTVANIRRVKGIDVLLHAAARVREVFPRVLFLVLGDVLEPEYYSDILRVRDALGLASNVVFSGVVDDVFGVLKVSDVFCLPSRSEGLSNALLEAMACGLPSVATRVGGNPELIESGVQGLLAPQEDAAALASSIVYLLRHPEVAARMGAAASARVEEQFSVEAMMQQLVRSYEHLLDKRV